MPEVRSGLGPLMGELYADLRSMASRFLRREGASHTFEPTDLVSESFLKLADQARVRWQGPTHVLAASARAMRRILIDHARGRYRKKRGGRGRIRFELRDDHACSTECPDEILFVNDILDRLERLDPLLARVLKHRLFDGLTTNEVAATLGVSPRTVERHCAMVRAWFLKEVANGP